MIQRTKNEGFIDNDFIIPFFAFQVSCALSSEESKSLERRKT